MPFNIGGAGVTVGRGFKVLPAAQVPHLKKFPKLINKMK
jgi:hypothetical protein